MLSTSSESMTLNTAHADNGVLLFNREIVLLYTSKVCLKWYGQSAPEFQGTKKGSIYLTTHRMVFISRKTKDPMQSFSFPFVTLSDINIAQPVFGANYVKGKVVAQANGNWSGEATFKIIFDHGGAIQFGQALTRSVQLAQRHGPVIPPHVAPIRRFFVISDFSDHYAPGNHYFGWMPPVEVFPERPENQATITQEPPPYEGLPLPRNRRLN